MFFSQQCTELLHKAHVVTHSLGWAIPPRPKVPPMPFKRLPPRGTAQVAPVTPARVPNLPGPHPTLAIAALQVGVEEEVPGNSARPKALKHWKCKCKSQACMCCFAAEHPPARAKIQRIKLKLLGCHQDPFFRNQATASKDPSYRNQSRASKDPLHRNHTTFELVQDCFSQPSAWSRLSHSPMNLERLQHSRIILLNISTTNLWIFPLTSIH